jgi:hypothetical protein
MIFINSLTPFCYLFENSIEPKQFPMKSVGRNCYVKMWMPAVFKFASAVRIFDAIFAIRAS